MMRTCDSAIFPVGGGEYTKVCGRIMTYIYLHSLPITAKMRQQSMILMSVV